MTYAATEQGYEIKTGKTEQGVDNDCPGNVIHVGCKNGNRV